MENITKALSIAVAYLMAAPVAAVEPGNNCNASSLDSEPGQAWMKDYGWRYESRGDAEKAYTALLTENSPWPSWYTPTVTALQPGTLFQMAMSPGQRDDQPGGFGTFDNIETVAEVYEYLAVLKAWKPDIERINTYRVTEPLLVYVGPIGPQIDPVECKLLPGRFSQFQMLVPRGDRENYLALVSSRKLPQTDRMERGAGAARQLP